MTDKKLRTLKAGQKQPYPIPSNRSVGAYTTCASLLALQHQQLNEECIWLGPIPSLVGLVDLEFIFISVRIPKTVDLAGLEGLLNLLPLRFRRLCRNPHIRC